MMRKTLAFLRAVAVGKVEDLDALLVGGDEVNQLARHEDYTFSPLKVAVIYGRLDMIQKLLLRGAKIITEIDSSGKNVLMFATNFNYEKIQKELAAISFPVPPVMKPDTLVQIVSELLSAKDVNEKIVNIQDKYGRTALMFAASRGYLEIVDLLLSHGAYITLSADNLKAINYAIQGGSLDIVSRLLDEGAEIENKEKPSESLLIDIASCIKNIADEEGSDTEDEDKTALDLLNNHFKIVDQLLFRGANIDILYQQIMSNTSCRNVGQAKFFEVIKACKHEREAYYLIKNTIESFYEDQVKVDPVKAKQHYGLFSYKNLVQIIDQYLSPTMIKKHQ